MESKYTVHFTKVAMNDLDEIYQYIIEELFAVDAAMELLYRIESSIMRLRLFPNSGSRIPDEYLRLKGYRRIIVDSYIIFYIVDDQLKQVIIMRILYGKRKYENLLWGEQTMSLTSYIGSNVPIAEKGYEEVATEGEIFVGPSFSDEGSLTEVKEAQFSTTYVYEVTFNSWGMELSSYQDGSFYEENKNGLHQVCEMMDPYLDVGEFFEFYTCWVGDEFNTKEAEITLPIRGWYTKGMELREQTLIRFIKNES